MYDLPMPQGNAKTWTFTRPLANLRCGIWDSGSCRQWWSYFVSVHHHFVCMSYHQKSLYPVLFDLSCGFCLWDLPCHRIPGPPNLWPQVRLFGRPSWKTAGEAQGQFIYWSTCCMTAWIPGCHHTLGPMGRHKDGTKVWSRYGYGMVWVKVGIPNDS